MRHSKCGRSSIAAITVQIVYARLPETTRPFLFYLAPPVRRSSATSCSRPTVALRPRTREASAALTFSTSRKPSMACPAYRSPWAINAADQLEHLPQEAVSVIPAITTFWPATAVACRQIGVSPTAACSRADPDGPSHRWTPLIRSVEQEKLGIIKTRREFAPEFKREVSRPFGAKVSWL